MYNIRMDCMQLVAILFISHCLALMYSTDDERRSLRAACVSSFRTQSQPNDLHGEKKNCTGLSLTVQTNTEAAVHGERINTGERYPLAGGGCAKPLSGCAQVSLSTSSVAQLLFETDGHPHSANGKE